MASFNLSPFQQNIQARRRATTISRENINEIQVIKLQFLNKNHFDTKGNICIRIVRNLIFDIVLLFIEEENEFLFLFAQENIMEINCSFLHLDYV